MKTPLHFYKDKYNMVADDSKFDLNTTVSISRSTLHELMRDYALYIAAEQDKRTKDAVAAEVGEDCPYLPIEDLMNLQTQIKELK